MSANGSGNWPLRRLGRVILLCLAAAALNPTARATAVPPQRLVEGVRAAETAYEEARYGEALGAWRRVLAAGWHAPQLYYNLGCAASKAGEIGWAVAYFEEARRLAPRDPNVLHNLRVASARGGDRLPAESPSRLLELLSGILDSYRPADVLGALVALLWASALALSAHWLIRPRWRPWSRRALGLIALLLVLLVSGLLLKAYQISSAPSGAVVAPEARVLSGPREGETVQFVLHGGTLLHLGRSAGEWREVWLSDQMRGWVARDAVVPLQRPRWLP